MTETEKEQRRYALAISGDTGAVIRLCARIYKTEAQKYEVEK